MSEEDVTQTTRYVRAVEAVAEAARRVEEARVKYEDTVDELMREQREAKKALHAALAHVMELTGKTLPLSERDKEKLRLQRSLDELKE